MFSIVARCLLTWSIWLIKNCRSICNIVNKNIINGLYRKRCKVFVAPSVVHCVSDSSLLLLYTMFSIEILLEEMSFHFLQVVSACIVFCKWTKLICYARNDVLFFIIKNITQRLRTGSLFSSLLCKSSVKSDLASLIFKSLYSVMNYRYILSFAVCAYTLCTENWCLPFFSFSYITAGYKHIQYIPTWFFM